MMKAVWLLKPKPHIDPMEAAAIALDWHLIDMHAGASDYDIVWSSGCGAMVVQRRWIRFFDVTEARRLFARNELCAGFRGEFTSQTRDIVLSQYIVGNLKALDLKSAILTPTHVDRAALQGSCLDWKACLGPKRPLADIVEEP